MAFSGLIMVFLTERTLNSLRVFHDSLPQTTKLCLELGTLQDDLRMGVAHVKMVCQCNFLKRLFKIGESTNEIMHLARRISGQSNRAKHWEKSILQVRISNKVSEMAEAKSNWEVQSKFVDSRLSKKVSEEVQEHQDCGAWGCLGERESP